MSLLTIRLFAQVIPPTDTVLIQDTIKFIPVVMLESNNDSLNMAISTKPIPPLIKLPSLSNKPSSAGQWLGIGLISLSTGQKIQPNLSQDYLLKTQHQGEAWQKTTDYNAKPIFSTKDSLDRYNTASKPSVGTFLIGSVFYMLTKDR